MLSYILQIQQTDAARRLTQQGTVAAGAMWDHDYAAGPRVVTEERTPDHNYAPEEEDEHVHLRSRFGSRRFASSDQEIHFHTGYVCVGVIRASPHRRSV